MQKWSRHVPSERYGQKEHFTRPEASSLRHLHTSPVSQIPTICKPPASIWWSWVRERCHMQMRLPPSTFCFHKGGSFLFLHALCSEKIHPHHCSWSLSCEAKPFQDTSSTITACLPDTLRSHSFYQTDRQVIWHMNLCISTALALPTHHNSSCLAAEQIWRRDGARCSLGIHNESQCPSIEGGRDEDVTERMHLLHYKWAANIRHLTWKPSVTSSR